MDMGTAIVRQYPDAVPAVDFLFTDETEDGTLKVKHWNEEKLGPAPESVQALQAWADTQELEHVKEIKKREIADAAIDDMSSAYTKGIDGKDELQFELTKAVMAIGQALGIESITGNGKLKAVVLAGDKARGKQVDIEAAETVEEVQEIEWGT